MHRNHIAGFAVTRCIALACLVLTSNVVRSAGSQTLPTPLPIGIGSYPAGTVHLAWDASPSPGVVGYKLYVDNGTPVDVPNVDTVTAALPPGPHHFCVTATGGSDESICAELDLLLVAPQLEPPSNLHAVLRAVVANPPARGKNHAKGKQIK